MLTKPVNFKDWQNKVRTNPAQTAADLENRARSLSSNEFKSVFATLLDAEKINAQFKQISRAESAPLSQVPFLLQDMFDVKDCPTGSGAPLKELFADPADSSSRLYQELIDLGACYIGKIQPSEFGIDPGGGNPTFGDCQHPLSNKYLTGGGAGAAAAAVKKGYAPLAFGLDTYGGVRIPAAFMGLFGFRMENNRLAREGVFPIAPSIESAGFLVNSLEDLETTFKALYKFKSVSSDKAVNGCFVTDLTGDVSLEIKQGMMKLCRALEAYENLSVSTRLARDFKDAGTALNVILSRELYSIHKYWIEEYEDKYDPHLLQFIENGMDCSPSAAETASQTQGHIRRSILKVFETYDYILLPISTVPNPLKEEWSQDMEDSTIHLNAPASLGFLPALILPFTCGGERLSAAQLLINPNKLELVPSILEKVQSYYAPLVGTVVEAPFDPMG